MRQIQTSIRLFLFLLLLFWSSFAGEAWSATAVDLSVSAYTLSPDPAVHNGTSTFSVTVTNNDYVDTANGLALAVNLPSNVDFSASPTPSGCSFASGRTILNCSLSTLVAQGTWNVTFTGVGLTPGVQSTDATVSATDNTDRDSNNDSLSKPITVINGADLIIIKTGPGGCTTGSCNSNAGATISFNIAVNNNGPDPATTFRVIDNLPATADFTYSSATGTGWSCSLVTTTVTCNYSGASIASGGSAPPITLTGVVITTAGSITNGASVASTDSSTGDPNQTNNGPSQVRVDVTQTTDLRANKTMVSVATGTTSFALGEAVRLTLSVTNQGPRDATGVTITDNIPADFNVDSLPGSCSGGTGPGPHTITCTVGALSNGATSSNFVINLTAPNTSGSGTNTATPGRTTPAAGANTPASVNYTVAAATANLQANKTMVSVANGSTTFAYNEAVRLTLSVTNNGPQNATGVTITDDVPAGFVIGTPLQAGCGAVGQTITCTVGALNNGATSSNYVISLTAPGTDSSGTNTATPGRVSEPLAGANIPATTNYTIAAPYANLRTNKTMVSAAPGSTNGTNTFVRGEAVTLTLSVTNLGLHDATGVAIIDTVSAVDFTIGTLPSGCSITTPPSTITCTVGALSSGATSSNFVIPLIALRTMTGGSNNACVSRTLPSGGTNTCSSTVDYNIIEPYAHLTLTKSKTPSLVASGADITNTLVVTNAIRSSSAATGTIRVTDVLSANETFSSYTGSGWSCSGVVVGATGTLTCDYASANLARGASLPSLVITTKAADQQGNISNTACTGQSASSPHLPADDSSANNCATATVLGSNLYVGISITKVASIASPTHITAADNSFTYTLVVSNASDNPNIAPTVNISDPLPAWVAGGPGIGTTGSAVITGGAGTGESCTFGSTVNCTLKDLTKGSPRTITIIMNRRLVPGSFTNTATATTPDSIDTPGTKFATADVIIDPVADVLVTNIAGAPNPVRVGVQLTYTTSIKNNGPDTAAGVVLRQRINLASWLPGSPRMSFVTGSAAISSTTATCNFVTFGAGPYAGDEGVECTGFSLIEGESRQLVFKVIPVYTYPDGVPSTFTSVADITTTTAESNYVNSNTNTVTINEQSIDLTVTNNDPGYDPTAFGDFIIYQILVQNNGPSQATGFMLTVTPTLPAQAPAPDPYTMTYNNAGSTLPAGATCSQTPTPPVGSGPVTCYLAGSRGASIMAPSTGQTFNLRFDTGPIGNNPSGSKTFKTTAVVSSYETGEPPTRDTLPANNTVSETTTVLPKTDLAIISKSVSGITFSINEPFTYTVVAANYGPSTASGVRVSDTLPSGLAVTGAITATLGSGSLVLNNCSSSGSPVTVTCDLGVLPVYDILNPNPNNLVTINIPVKAPYGTYTAINGFNTNRPNFATIAPLPNTSLDTIPGNNTSNTVNVQIVKSSIAGSVYSDNNMNNILDSGEKITSTSVTFSLYGVDTWGNNIGTPGTPIAVATNTGDFLFDNLPSSPTGYTLIETQPSGYYDRFETVGTAGGTKPADTCDGVINCTSSPGANTISNIILTANFAATGYLFQEYGQAIISGYVYHDANNDGNKGGSETTGVSGNSITLSGTAYNGQSVNLTISTDGTGAYSYTPPPGTSYVVTQNTQPAGYLPGKSQNGSGVGNVVPGSAGVSAPKSINVGSVSPSAGYDNRNFGELLPAALSGYVFIDANSNAVRNLPSDSAGVTGVTITLDGTDDLGNTIHQTSTTTASGYYSFSSSLNLRPGTYNLTETPPPSLTHTGAQAGSKGGTINGIIRSSGTGVPGSGFVAITNITIVSADAATGYNFGESGQGLAGFVYVDLNNDGIKDASEQGIYNVRITLSGTTSDGRDVCVAISPDPCIVYTDSFGAYSYTNLPVSDSTGYALTEQDQSTAPLSNYADGKDTLGNLGGSTAVNDRFSGIVLHTGEFGANYSFGERDASLTGRVYLDVNQNNAYDPGTDTGIAGVSITLSGRTANNVDVCTFMTQVNPAWSCTTTTLADGSFIFTGLPKSDGTGYTLTEIQPVDYANGATSAGTPAGTSTTGTTISNIPLTTAGYAGTNYLFGEKTGSINGFVYHDANNDGVKDALESGIAGVTLTLSGTTASGVNICTTIPSCATTTAADGSYSFTGLRNSNGSGYTITETQPASYLDGKVTAGTVNGSPCAGCNASVANVISAIPFIAANTFAAFNFGELLAGTISGRVYHDFNNSSTYDVGEELAGVTITLTGTDDQGHSVTMITTTASDGTYSFTGLRPSDPTGYSITETQPAGIGNYAGNSGTQVGTINGNPVGTAPALTPDLITGIVLTSGTGGINYDFRDNAASLTGFVYLDADNSGTKDAGEPGIVQVAVRLTGTDANGVVDRTTTTDANGRYQFIGLTNGTYTLTETQPVIYQDGKESAGNPVGTIDNSSFTSNPAQNRISAITLPTGTAGSGYLFGERTGLPGSFSGKIWFESLIPRNQTHDTGEPWLPGWWVEAIQGSVVRGTATTGANGAWTISNIPAGSGYELRFHPPGSNAIYGIPVSQDPGYVDSTPNYSAMTIANMVLRSGGNVIEQNLPVDPSGVVYDSITRAPVSGATVAITYSGTGTFIPAVHLAGGTANQTQVTNATGFYQFLLLTGAPAGQYTISVTPPAGYIPGPSAIIPPTAGPYVVPGGAPVAIQVQPTAPTVSQLTTYYLTFTMGGLTASVLNNHIPVDPILGGAIIATKTTPLVNVKRGDLVPYTITMTNTLAATIPNIDVRDIMPPGFKYRTGSGTLNGVRREPVVAGRQLTWPNLTFTPGEKKTFLLILVVGSGVSEGEYTNQVYAANNIVNKAVSNVATATVRVIPDPTFDCPDIIGKVFDDKNANGYQDEGEPGIANVRLATVRGLIITTDAEGRFHIPCPEIPNENRGSNFILKLDERTLPSGYRVTTENPRVVRLTRGKMTKINFGATVHRVIRIDVNAAAFENESVKLREEWQQKIQELEKQLRERSTVVRIAYRMGKESRSLVDSRIKTIHDMLQVLWKKGKDCPPLVFEEEVVEVR